MEEGIRFYPKFTRLLNRLSNREWKFPYDFPRWCYVVSDYCQEWEYDDIILGDKLTWDEEHAFLPMFSQAISRCFDAQLILGDEFEYYGMASELFEGIQRKAMSTYFSRAGKDIEWKKVLADETMSNPDEFDQRLKDLVCMEKCMEVKSEQVVDDDFLCQKLFLTVTPSVKATILRDLLSNGPHSRIRCHTVTEALENFAYDVKYKKNPPNGKCSVCQSPFHSVPSCQHGPL